MPISSTANSIQSIATGTTTSFPFPYLFYDPAHLVVQDTNPTTQVTTTRVLGSDYTVSGIGLIAGGTVIFSSAPIQGDIITISRSVPLTQLLALVQDDNLPSAALQESLDLFTMADQQLNAQLGRSLAIPITDLSTTLTTLPPANVRANKQLGFDANGNVLVNADIGVWRGAWTTATAYNYRDLIQDSVTQNVYLALATYISGASLAADIAAGNLQLILNSAAATTAANSAANSAAQTNGSAISAAASASNASNSANNAANSAILAGTNASAAAASASNASNSATSAANSANAAATSAANLSAPQGPNAVLAGPSSGSTNATPTFRALVATDIPALNYLAALPTNPALYPTLNQSTTGTAANITGTLSAPLGGTGVTTGLTALNGSNVTSGTVADARLSTNIPLLNSNNIFTAKNSFGLGTAPAATIHAGGNVSSAAWGDNGIGLRYDSGTFTDTSTAASGTVTGASIHVIQSPTLAASNAVNYAGAATLEVNPPAYGTNVTGAIAGYGSHVCIRLKNGSLQMDAPSVAAAYTNFWSVNGVTRWSMGRRTEAESGGNTGSGFDLENYSDSGAFLNTVMGFNRATGYVQFNETVGFYPNRNIQFEIGGGNGAGNGWTGTAFGTLGAGFVMDANSYNDTGTAASGTVPESYINVFNAPTISATNTAVTYTRTSTLYVAAPVAGTNLTISKARSILAQGDIETLTRLATPRVYGTSAVPTVAAGAGAGTSPTVSVVGTDLAGVLTITTGTSPTAAGVIATITYAGGAYPTGSVPILTPANAATASFIATAQPYATGTTTTFVLTANATALAASTAYKWNYHVSGY